MSDKSSDKPILNLTLTSLREAMQKVGYRVEETTDPVANVPYLRSATGGLSFDVRPGNRLADADGGFVDIAFAAVLQVQGELPLDLVNRWNVTRRFARLQLSPPFLVFSLDVSVAGGVTQNYLRAQIEIWDRLVQDLIAYLREELRHLTAANAATPVAAPASAVAPVPERESGVKASVQATVQ
jgi:Putative bacterial sensory transduction regulator